MSCVRTDGETVDDALCTGDGSGPRPEASQRATITSTCEYRWQIGDWSVSTETCGSASITRDTTCIRSNDKVVAKSFCPSPAPVTTQRVSDYSGCSFAWTVGAWTGGTTQCGTTTQTREVQCERSDGSTAAEADCARTAPKPDTSQDVTIETGCAAKWVAGAFGAPVPACGPTIRTRTVACRSNAGQIVDDQECVAQKPTTTEEATDYSLCTDGRSEENPYAWTTGPYSEPTTTCGVSTRTRSVRCLDDKGAVAPDNKCAGGKPPTSITNTETSGCSYEWTAGTFGDPQPGCGTTVDTRTVACRRSDGAGAAPSFCDPETKPQSTRTTTDYSACTFGWSASAWSVVDTTCGNATQTRTVTCQRADGEPADDSSCRTPKPDTTQTSYQTTGCGYSWKAEPFDAPAPACGTTTQSRAVTCERGDGETVDASYCADAGEKPKTTQAASDFSTCTYHWEADLFPEPTNKCGTSTQTRTVTCMRSDGNPAASQALCTETKPETSETTTQTSGCAYSWDAGPFGDAAPACGASTHSRTVTCKRSDGATAASSALCTDTKPPVTEATVDYSTCTYDWIVGSWNGTNGCANTVTQTRDVACQRSNGDTVGDSSCTTTKPKASQTITDYSSCTYAWDVVYGAWSSSCSATASRTNTVRCKRQDGSFVFDGDEAYCVQQKPAVTETQPIFTSCTYTPTYGAYSTCSSTTFTQSATLTACTRADGTDKTAENAAANYANCAQTKTISCSPVYTPAYGAYGACRPSAQGSTTGTQTASITSCTANDGQVVSNGLCGAQTTSRSCTITRFDTTYGTPFGICSNSQQTTTIATCTTTDSTGIVGDVPTALCPGNRQTSTQSCTQNKTCGSFTDGKFISTRTAATGNSDTSLFVGSSTYGSAEFATARTMCENSTGTGLYCGISAPSAAACTNVGLTVGAGKRCYQAVIGPVQTLTNVSANAGAVAICSFN